MKEKRYKKLQRGIGLIATVMILTACADSSQTVINEPQPVVEENSKIYDAAMADSLDQAVLISKNTKKNEIRLQNIQTGKLYTLSYTGATTIQDKNGTELVMDQLEEGSLVTVTFLKDEKAAKALYLREDASVIQGVTLFEINKAAHTMFFDGQQYELDENVAVTAEGEKLELMDINDQDTLSVQAVDHTIYSISITKGHGYVKLVNYDYFLGGWVEVGQSVIKPVTEGMLLTVPEGSYSMLISKDGVGGTKEIEVARGEEIEVDVSDLQGEIDESQIGKIIFTVTPQTAKLYVDGSEVDYSEEVNLGYGVHQIACKAEGYATLSKYIKVSQEYASIDINLEVATGSSNDNSNSSVSGNTASADTAQDSEAESPTSDYKVYIDAPIGAELYVDGNYIGLIPASFPKKKGTYTISIRKSGYQTRSYSLQIDDAAKDVNYSFSELTQQ